MEINNNVAAVTGGASGLGRAAVLHPALQNYDA